MAARIEDMQIVELSWDEAVSHTLRSLEASAENDSKAATVGGTQAGVLVSRVL